VNINADGLRTGARAEGIFPMLTLAGSGPAWRRTASWDVIRLNGIVLFSADGVSMLPGLKT